MDKLDLKMFHPFLCEKCKFKEKSFPCRKMKENFSVLMSPFYNLIENYEKMLIMLIVQFFNPRESNFLFLINYFLSF
jgi:hypothetical protein